MAGECVAVVAGEQGQGTVVVFPEQLSNKSVTRISRLTIEQTMDCLGFVKMLDSVAT
jgi:hypothetical protein